jgi:hypothetical protein
MQEVDSLLTEQQAAKELRVQPCTLRKWRVRGRGPVFLRFTKKIRYRKEDLATYVLDCRVDPKARRTKRGSR